MTDEHVERLSRKDEEMRSAYDRVRETYPQHAQAGQGVPSIDAAAAFRKRLLYRSKQRGWLEVDLLMGAWAEGNLAAMPDAELKEYERILNAETIDLYNYVTGKEKPPPHLDGPVMQRLIQFSLSAPLGKADPEAYAKAKRMFTN